MANEIWKGNNFRTCLTKDYEDFLLSKEIPFEETDENIAKELDILLTKIREYRDKYYPQ